MVEPIHKLSDYVPGRWSTTPPNQPGVYVMRIQGDRPWVANWELTPWTASTATGSTPTNLEFFHLAGDADGHPTRWDDPRVVQMAGANGWYPRAREQSRRIPKGPI